ncbi:flagellar hook assembly protein FlgD [Desulfoplanes formicivorans]|uniref:Basal-body rod modification protein FlgD n=1 Tax=Desulfoplanes formicivorans TaxID=1592317 RepID=A0A194AF69_9BACT|nr:flagellar hook capping FlgD N-terminal domain-containing protein [Desulfoplanes formicivorans]GAU07978.1 flagellar hook capping protein [Desulfoplanes formicivorans]
MSGIQTAGNILGAYERDQAAASQGTGDATELGKDAFLQLLVTQLENQDPLEPMEDTEFISQLAQFSNLEQMTNISEGIDTLVENSTQDMLNGVNYIGKGVVSAGSTISKSGEESSTLYYTIDESAVKMTINIFDAAGNLIDSEEVGAQQAGTYAFNWDGIDYDGQEQPDGTYSVTFAAEDVNGQPVLTSTEVAGIVTSVESLNGQTLLNLSDGRSVNMLDVREVAMVSQETGQDTQGESE